MRTTSGTFAKKTIINLINFLDRSFGLREILQSENEKSIHPLAGDRAIEWSWVIANLPKLPVNILDLGCVQSVLTGTASRLGHNVTAVDLRNIEYSMENVTFIQKDICKIDFNGIQFDVIMNCSMIEHMGLEGRYGSYEKKDADLVTMKKLKYILSPSGYMILTIPVGQDEIFFPQHRIYGSVRLPLLLLQYEIIKEEYWMKDSSKKWINCSKEKALIVQGMKDFYALGLFILKSNIQSQPQR